MLDRTGAFMGTTSDAYVFTAAEHDRIHAAEELLDSTTEQLLLRIGVNQGAHCLEVGAGGGSIASWLLGVVGAHGQVVATDIDVRALSGLPADPRLEIREHDLIADDIEAERFDLIHARLFLEHLPQRDLALSKMVMALRPGGWLVVESVDYVAAEPVSEFGAAEHARSQSVRLHEFEKLGISHHLGRRLPAMLRANGLVEVGNEGRVWIMEGGSPGARWFKLSMAHLRSRLVGEGKLNDAEIDRMLELFDNPNWAAFSPVIVGAWGQKPA
jgi:SAM-dependent methyltransferase